MVQRLPYPKLPRNLKKMTEAANKLSYLDIMIEIEDSCFWTDAYVYDKRDGFGLHILNFPILSSNTPLSQCSLLSIYLSTSKNSQNRGIKGHCRRQCREPRSADVYTARSEENFSVFHSSG